MACKERISGPPDVRDSSGGITLRVGGSDVLQLCSRVQVIQV